MAKSTSSSKSVKRSRPALTPEARENQLIAKAMNEAERRIDDGTASSQLLSHFLKLGTEKARLEKEKLRRESILLEAKVEQLESSKRLEALYENAMKALKGYRTDADE